MSLIEKLLSEDEKQEKRDRIHGEEGKELLKLIENQNKRLDVIEENQNKWMEVMESKLNLLLKK